MGSIRYRVLTSWIRDIASKPSMGRRWPMVDMDDGLVEDYRELIDLAAEWGYNGLVAWGLFVGHNWPVELDRCLNDSRSHCIDQIMSHAQKRGLDFYIGLGTYSWGFEDIIKAEPRLRQGEQIKAWGRLMPHNGDVMCFDQPGARQWMHDIIDFIVERTGAQAFQLQPFDKGRCMCPICGQLSDARYFSALIGDTARYIRSKWPKAKVGVSGWGMRYDSDDALTAVGEFADSVDYICDVTNSCLDMGRDYRRSFISALPCAFGDSAGGSVTPPQTWERLRWYLPHIRFNGDSIRATADDGGAAIELFAGPLANPGTRISLMALGYVLEHTDTELSYTARLAVEAAYGLRGGEAQRMADLVLRAEASYFDNCAPMHSSDVLFEPLESVYPNRPLYLLGRGRDALERYCAQLDDLISEAGAICVHAVNQALARDTIAALQNAAMEVRQVLAGAWDWQ